MYRVDIERRALKDTKRFPRQDKQRIVEAIDSLSEDPRPHGCRPVRAAPHGTYRIRVGNYRVIYIVDDNEQTVTVARIARRDEDTYKDLR
jgi:mRNA interferase RelE/StbE